MKTTPPDVAERLAAVLLVEAGVPPEPPIDLVAVAVALGVRDIAVADIVQDGRVEAVAGGFSVTLGAHTASLRQRFTLAHELAHIALADDDHLVAHRGAVAHGAATERLCDAVAASLLLPRQWILSLADLPPDMSSVSAVAERASVSKTAAFLRLRDVLAWDLSMLRFGRSRSNDWRVLRIYRRTRGLFAWPAPTERTAHALDLISRANGVMPCDFELLVAGRGRHFSGTALGGPTSALAIGRLAGPFAGGNRRRATRLDAALAPPAGPPQRPGSK